ncbi:MAG: GAF domain-containing protein [Akkermansiaceae bacterium]|nr:GAF domain-containing protein [Armatimonadota bacterium]
MDRNNSDTGQDNAGVGTRETSQDTDGIGLQPLTAALLECVTPAEVVEVVVGRGVSVLGAEAGLVVMVRERQSIDGQDFLEIVGARGYSEEVLASWGRFALTDTLPLSDAVREQTPLFWTSHAAMKANYPEMFRRGPTHPVKASVSLPLVVRGRALGGLHFAFPEEREEFNEADRALLQEMARQCALALDRALLLQQLEETRQRQEFLARASALLAESLDYQTTLDAIARLAVPTLCDWAAVDIVDASNEGGPLLNLAVAHVNPDEVAWVRAAQRRFPVDMTQTGQPIVRVISTGDTVFLPDIPEEILLAAAQDAEHLRLIRRLDLRSYICVPLNAHGHTLGAVTFASNRGSGRIFTPETVKLVEELGRRAAVAVDNARLYAQAQREATERREAEERFRFMANSAPVLIWTSGTDAKCDWFNKPWLSYTGRTMEQEVGDGWADGVHPDDFAHCLKTYRDSFNAHQPFTMEYRLRRSDGDYRWLLDSGVPVFDGEGSDRAFKGYIGSCVDIMEMKQGQIEREQLLADLREASLRQRRFLKEMLAGFTEGRLRLCSTEDELPTPLPPQSDPVDLTPTSLRLLRKQLEAVAEGLNFPKERLGDFLTASHEAAMNAVRHGGGGAARIHGDRDTGVVQVWVADHGPGIAEEMIHRAVEQGFTTGGFGQGFFYMQSCADRLYLLSVADAGTTVVLEMDRTPPKPRWLGEPGLP